MSVAIVASFPWQAILNQARSQPQAAILLSDTRLVIGGAPIRHRVSKQFRLASNLTTTFTTTNLYAITEALFDKAGEPTTKERTSIASVRDVRRLGEHLNCEHIKHGGWSAVLASIFELNATSPTILELMPPDYKPVTRTGVLGIGNDHVINCFKQLAEKRMKEVGGNIIVSTPEQGGCDLMLDLAEAIDEASEPSVALPYQGTVHRVDTTMSDLRAKIRRKSGQWEFLTIDDKDLGGLPSITPRKEPSYTGGCRRSRQILE